MYILSLLSLAVLAGSYHLDSQPIPSLDGNLVREMCAKNGADYKAVEAAASETYLECMLKDIGPKEFEREIQNAVNNGSFDKLIKRYCAKSSQLKTCTFALLDTVSPCISDKDQYLITTTKTVFEQIFDYICGKDSYTITSLLTADGSQCVSSKSKDIITCLGSLENPLTNMKQAHFVPLANSQKTYLYNNLAKYTSQMLETCVNLKSSKIFKKIAGIARTEFYEEIDLEEV